MKRKHLLILIFLIAIVIISIVVILSTHEKPKKELSDFEKGLTVIKFDININTKFANLFELKSLLGKDKKYIEREFTNIDVFQDYPTYDFYRIDKCAVVYYENDIVVQISMGIYITESCIEENFIFDKATRLNLLGPADKESRLTGLPGFGEYSYIDEGVSIIKSGNQIMQVWIADPKIIKDYFDKLSGYRLNFFGYNPGYDVEGKVLKATEEE